MSPFMPPSVSPYMPPSYKIVLILFMAIFVELAMLSKAYALAIPGIKTIDYQGGIAFTDDKAEVILVGQVVDMGVRSGEGNAPGVDLSIQQVKQNIGDKLTGKYPDAVIKTPLTGIYELYYGKQVLYVDGSGRFLFRNGQLHSAKGENLTTTARSKATKMLANTHLKQLSLIADDEMLVYPARHEKSVIRIFTDVDCPFCSRIHTELETYAKAGITIKYLFFPRAGRQSAAYRSFVNVWCSHDPYTALEKVEAGQHIPSQVCDHPVEKHLRLAESLRLTGTPVIVLQDGTLLVGYKNPDQLIKMALAHTI